MAPVSSSDDDTKACEYRSKESEGMLPGRWSARGDMPLFCSICEAYVLKLSLPRSSVRFDVHQGVLSRGSKPCFSRITVRALYLIGEIGGGADNGLGTL